MREIAFAHRFAGRVFAATAFCLTVLCPLSLASAPGMPILRAAESIRLLSAADAAKSLPAEISGVVTYVDPDWETLFVQDSSAGIFVYLHGAKVTGEIRVGSRVSVSGVTTPGDFVASIINASIVAEGTTVLPRPLQPDPDEVLSGKLDSQWVGLAGVVRSGRIERGRLYISLNQGGSKFTLTLKNYPKAWLTSLADSEVQATGVLSMRFNKRRQVIGANLNVPGEGFIRIIKAAPEKPYLVPESAIGSLGQFSAATDNHRVHVQGTVEAVETGGAAYVSDGADTVLVQGRGCRAHPGDLVQVVGFPAFVDYHRSLEDAVCRKVGPGLPRRPQAVAPENILQNSTSDQASDTRNDMSVIQTEGRLLQSSDGSGTHSLLLEAGGMIFAAAMPATGAEPATALEIGSNLRLTGFCLIKYDAFQKAESFRLILRSPSDIAIVSKPSWWNLRHTFWALGLMALIIGTVLFWVGTLRRRVERQTSIIRAKLQREARLEGRYQRLFEANLASVLTFSTEGCILDCNPAFAGMLGFASPAEVRLSRLQPKFIAEPELQKFIDQVQSNASAAYSELSFLHVDGSCVRVLASGLVTDTEDNGPILQATLIDVTAQRRFERDLIKAKEAAEMGSRLKSEFLANMSHEIRTPLNGVLGMTSLALSAEITNEVREYLGMAHDCATHLLTLLNDILDYSKIEAGKLVLEKALFSPREVFRKAVRTLAVKAHEKGLELFCRIDDSVPETLTGDPHRLQQILLNLVGNAVKFTEAGEVIVNARGAPARNPAQFSLNVSVQDTGLGIAPDRQVNIFEPFIQADGSTTRKFGGSGLGLSICTQLVSMMGGELSVESTPGAGSRFSFSSVLDSSGINDTAANKAGISLLRSKDIIVAVENRTVREILEDLTASWGMIPLSTLDFNAIAGAIEEAKNEGRAAPLLLIDGRVSHWSAFDLIEKVHDLGAPPSNAIVMLDSINLRESAERCNALQTAYTIKPVDAEELRTLLLRAVMAEPFAGRTKVSARAAENTSAESRSLTILLAEDNRVNQRLACVLLSKSGHTVEVACDGREAVKAASGKDYDVVLMDVQMPGLDGFEATAEIRKLKNQSRANVPIIALTAHAIEGYRERCLRAGMNGYLTKPIEPARLSHVLSLLPVLAE